MWDDCRVVTLSSQKKSTEEEQDSSKVVVRKKPSELEQPEETLAITDEPATEPRPTEEDTAARATPVEQAPAAPVEPAAKAAPADPPAIEAPAVDAEPVEPVVEATTIPRTEPPKLAAAPVSREPEEEEEMDFAALLGASRVDRVEQGEMVTGQLVAISGQWAFVDLGAKTEGILAVAELKDDDGNLTKNIGDDVEAFVVSTRGGEIKLSQSLGKSIRDYESLRDAQAGRIPVDGRVTGTNKGGYEVMIAGRRAFCPASQIELAFTEDPSVHVGMSYQFRVTEIADRGKRIVVSRAALLREERKRRQEELKEQLFEGAILEGEVRSVQEYGAFIDLGGIEGLAHVSELSWRRVEHPSEVVNVGDQVEVKILSIKEGEKGSRISLSIREAQPHPWIAVGTKFVIGETYDGIVTRTEAFGAFVELGPGVEGLVHVSEMSWEKRVNHGNEILEPGQNVRVYLKDIDHERKRIALSLKALAKDPWVDADERYGVGMTVNGTVEKIQPFGIFLEVEPGITALIPASESGTGTGSDLRREFAPGKSLTATVLSVDQSARRMSLSLKAAGDAVDKAEIKDFFDKQKQAKSGGSLGTLGDLFADKLGKG